MPQPYKKLTPLSLSLVDEGLFISQADADLMDCQKTLLEFRDRHGNKAKGAKCKLTIEVTLCCENSEEELFSVKAVTKKSLPARPPSTTIAMSAQKDNGEIALFVRRSGSTDTTPRQSVLSTQAGETVDVETGEVKK